MLKFCLITLSLAIPVLVSGCASKIKDQVEAAEENAPTWYEKQKDEVVNRGYPEFSSIPQTSQRGPIPKEIVEGEEGLEAQVKQLDNDPKAQTVAEAGLEDSGEWARRMREEVEKGIPKD